MAKIKFIIFLIIIGAAIAAIYFFNTVYGLSENRNEAINVNVTAGESTAQVIRELTDKKLIKNPLIFKVYLFLTDSQSRLLPGNHVLYGGMNMPKIIAELKSEVNNEKKITIIEGWNVNDIAKYLEEQGLGTGAEFLQAIKIKNWRDEFDYLHDVKAETVEGFLFPDTYRVFTDATANDIIRKMLANFNVKMTSAMRANILSQNKSIFQIVTMASIVEREVMTDADRAMVADIFWKRIAAGMALQSDATVNYITGNARPRPTAADLQVDSPYNTYKYRGLPPGPISSPGRASIKAAIYPQPNDYYYFITDSKGKAIFSKDFEEHKLNVQKYLNH